MLSKFFKIALITTAYLLYLLVMPMMFTWYLLKNAARLDQEFVLQAVLQMDSACNKAGLWFDAKRKELQ
jgi:hypothetical protein